MLPAVFVAALVAALVCAAGARADAAAELYDPSRVVLFDLQLPPASVQSLKDAPETYVEGTLSYAPAAPGGTTPAAAFSAPIATSVRLKGSASFRPFTGKAAFKLKFAKATPFLGLRKMTLNNMVEDPSMVHEALAYAAFADAGVPASRSGYAYLRVNGEDFGLYANVETLDPVSLTRLFGSFDAATQHLYEGEYKADVTPDGAGLFEVDEGDEANLSDLEALVTAAAGGEDAGWAGRVAPHADLAEMTRMWAVERYIGSWDSYSGSGGELLPNNYYLLSDPTGSFRMLPWGQDEAWTERLPFEGDGGHLFDRCLADPACRQLYRAAVGVVRDTVGAQDLERVAAERAAMVRPFKLLELAESSRVEQSLEEAEGAQAETIALISARRGESDAWLGRPVVVPGKGGSSGPGPGSGPVARSAALRVGRASLEHGAIVTRVRTAGAAVLVQRASLVLAGQRRVACRAVTRIVEPGLHDLRCPLTPVARVGLAERWRYLRLATKGLGEERARTLRVARTGH